MKQKWKKGIAIIMAITMLGCVADQFPQSAPRVTLAAEKTDAAQAYSTDGLQPDMTANLNAQNYRVYGNLVTSYLVAEEDGYMRVQFVPKDDSGSSDGLPINEPKKDLLVVEYYDAQFQLKSQRYIDEEKKLESLAGFYAGSDYYYVVWKQTLDVKNWSADEVFMRVIKYDKTWQVQGSLDLNSNNGNFLGLGTAGNNSGVVNPCEAGSLNMTEYGGHLYINSCYENVGGHQGSMMFDIVESDMSSVQTTYSVANYYAKVSHSYNQFLLVDDGLSPKRMVTLNHGDGFEDRGAALGQYELDTAYTTDRKEINKEITTFSCAGGEIIDNNVRNYTGASLGGLECSANSYVVAGNSIEQVEEMFLTAEQRNIFVTATSRTDFSIENTKVYWLTDYTEDEGVAISTPQLVKMSEDRILVMWREGKQIPHETGKLMYRFLDADGKPLGETKTAAAEITDCKPVVKDGKAVWYSSSVDEGVYFYTIDSQGTFEAHGVNTVAGVPAVNKVELQKDGVYLEWKPVDGADGYCIVRNKKPEAPISVGPHYAEIRTNYQSTYIEGGSTGSYLDKSEYIDGDLYEYRVCSYRNCNGRKILSYGCDKIERWLFKGVQFFSALENVASGVKLSWKPYNPHFNPSEFRIYRSGAGMADAKLIGTVKGAAERYSKDSVESFIDTTAVGGAAYDYSIETCRGEGVSARLYVYSFVRVETPQVTAVCNPDNTITVSWSKASGAEKYYLRPYIWSEGSQEYIPMMSEPKQEMSPDNLSCTISGLEEGTKYQFGVIGKSKFIQTPSMTVSYGFDSEEAKVEIATYKITNEDILQRPTIISWENTSEGIKVEWTPVEGAERYEIGIWDSADTYRQESLTGTGTVYVDKNVVEGEYYQYKVRAYGQIGAVKTYGYWSTLKKLWYQKPAPTLKPTAKPTPKPTSPPTIELSAPKITSIEITEEGIALTWDKVEGADEYWIYDYSVETFDMVLLHKTSKLNYTDTRVGKEKTYYYVVYARSAGGDISGRSEIASIQYRKPQAPVLKSLTCIEEGVKVEWEPVEDAGGYYVYFYESVGPEEYFCREIEGGDANSAVIDYPDGSEGKMYSYYVVAYKFALKSWMSNVKAINIERPKETQAPVSPTPAFDLPAPELKSLSCFRSEYGNGIELTWEPVEGADGYIMYSYENGVKKQPQATAGGDTDSYKFYDLREGATYQFEMAAYKRVDFGTKEGTMSRMRSIVLIIPSETASPSPGTAATAKPDSAVTAKPGSITTAKPGSADTPKPGSAATAKPDSADTPNPDPADTPKPGSSDIPDPYPTGAPKPDSTDIPDPGPMSTVTPTSTLSVPKLVELKCVSDGVEITWEPVEDADGYFVKYYNEQTPDLIQTHILEGHDTVSYVDLYGIEGERYIYSVAAYKSTPDFEMGGYSESRGVIYLRLGASSPVSPEPTVNPGLTVNPEPAVNPEPTVKPEQTLQPVPTDKPQSTVESESKKPGKPAIKKLKNMKGKKVKVTLSKKVSGATGYQAAYATKSSMKKQKVKSFKGTGVTVKGLKKKKTYYFRVRAFVKINGNIVYGSWGKKKKIKIKK